MIRRDNRQAIRDAFLDVHRQVSNDSFDNQETHYTIENISRGGLRFCSENDDYQVDERIEIVVHLSNGDTHSAMARICYCDRNGRQPAHYGVSFLDNFLEMAKCV